jgi:hypothetical protein
MLHGRFWSIYIRTLLKSGRDREHELVFRRGEALLSLVGTGKSTIVKLHGPINAAQDLARKRQFTQSVVLREQSSWISERKNYENNQKG